MQATSQREQRSLFGEILDWMLAPLLLLWPMSVALTWLVAQSIANRPFDRALAETARTIARQVIVERETAGQRSRVRLRLPEVANEVLRSDEADRVFFQVLGARGEYIAGDRELPVPDEPAAPAQELRYRDDDVQSDAVRVAYVWLPSTGIPGEVPPLVQVAETLDKRSRLATEIIKGVIVPQFVVLPLAVLLVWFALARGIKPLNELQQRIRRRESHDLSPLQERDVPEEVAPLVGAINELLGRLDHSIGAQKHFLADAAHQLKTPLAGLRMQAELAQREIDAGEQDPKALKRSLQQIAHASQRAAHMVNQLLAMARAEDKESAARGKQEVNLARLARETVRDFVPRALENRIDLGYEGPEEGQALHGRLAGQPLLIRELIRNLVDNALQYTPAGGSVTVRVMDDPFGQVIVLQVEDTGPGIPQAERELVFRPFYRALGTNVDGSGLGLAIVREIVQQHGAEVAIGDARNRAGAAPVGSGPGALFTVRFPLARRDETVADGASAPSSPRPDDQPGGLAAPARR
ncbi:sensor histidine kinase N-terminal domain-containing protein [Aquincola sp. S2]|uniref:histidine kinase n=1 Tax=Pseudaquabacterium terrae TaxID=2732868 RepID=A0ABX2EKK3_9BURK|nr:sensor histidine kinase [Aquabacterium terrae]NRF69186.1 sensor histidine kinase N-terminal domain-containing protein [Aquabacterium terrae]